MQIHPGFLISFPKPIWKTVKQMTRVQAGLIRISFMGPIKDSIYTLFPHDTIKVTGEMLPQK